MPITSILKDDSGVENAVYGILMIAIVVMVALLIGSLVLSQGGQVQVLASSPKASLTGVMSGGTAPSMLINHESGDPLQVSQILLNVYDDDGVLIGSTQVSSVSPAVTPAQLSPGMQTSAIPLSLNPGGTIDTGSRYTVKVVSSQSKQQIGSIVLVAR
ncbi:type IV pilin [Methanocella sp. MCL-LM]|uniref:type IV pilin n=1 Tax=Methanocella sp. MCL-LM TaxID=3412035 RepID=UPI003C722880